MAQPSRSTTWAGRSTHSYDTRARGCAWGWRRPGGGTPGRCWPPRRGQRRGGSARRGPSWSARSAATWSSRRRPGRWLPSARRGWASRRATRPSPPASAPRSTSSCSHRARLAVPARVTPRTRSRVASRRRLQTPGPHRRRAATARRAAAGTRACCCCRAGTCACAARARPAWTRAPSARSPRTPRSLSWSLEAYGVRPSVRCAHAGQDPRCKGFVYYQSMVLHAVMVHHVHPPLERLRSLTWQGCKFSCWTWGLLSDPKSHGTNLLCSVAWIGGTGPAGTGSLDKRCRTSNNGHSQKASTISQFEQNTLTLIQLPQLRDGRDETRRDGNMGCNERNRHQEQPAAVARPHCPHRMCGDGSGTFAAWPRRPIGQRRAVTCG